ncbi:hypothetical protein PDE_00103 [Penicillium oxalicum 114-2]|uniref:L-dopachrome isomerase n=1 Tax=Penicillium oxalicum (strain 114-2 / CGMCC 5302) TaxID=933388 RepID=S8ATM1_PENO1|nr:hypothetical protein PDE_00103 [Penicillium oxalicum 114-2]
MASHKDIPDTEHLDVSERSDNNQKPQSRSPSLSDHRSSHSSLPSKPVAPQSVENRLRPAADIINRINWDSEFTREDYIIGFVDRFEGQLEVSMDAWKKETTDEEFIPQHRVLYIRHVNGDIVWDRRRRIDKIFNSGSLPVLPSNVPADPIVQEPSQPEKQAVAPFLFQRNEDKEETVASLPEPETTKSKSISVANKNISQDAPAARSAAKKMFSEDEFANQASQSSPNDQVARDALVVAELSTNCKPQGNFQLVCDLVSHIAQIFRRPESAIQVVIHQNVSICFGSSTLPSYLLKIWTVPSAIGPFTNVRNTWILQQTLHESLAIPPERGVILFLSVSEENLGLNGSTIQGVNLRQEKPDNETPGVFKTISHRMSRRLRGSSGASGPITLSSGPNSPLSPTEASPGHSQPVVTVSENPAQEESSPQKRESLMAILERHIRNPKKGQAKGVVKD